MPEAIASVIGGGMQASGAKKAAKTSAEAQLEAARMQQEAAREALGLGREQFEYGQEQDLYQRALQRQQAAQQAAQLQQIQPFINLGLGSLQGLSQMVNPTMQVDPGLYGLAGMEPREATLRQPSQADWNPTFDYSAARAPTPAINFDEVDQFVQDQLAQRLATRAEDVVEEDDEEELPGRAIAPNIPEGISEELMTSNPGLALRIVRAQKAANERQRIFARNQRMSATGGRG